MKTNIIINTSFPAIHAWPDCSIEEVSFLLFPHRHIFHVVIKIPVSHDNREVEFIKAKMDLDAFIDEMLKNQNLGKMSCEMIINYLFTKCHFYTPTPPSYICVMEDNENGAEVYFD